MNSRDKTLDIIKGLLICLVVVGHCIQCTYTDNYADNYAFNWIYAFHMPFFFFLSGYSVGYSKKIDGSWLLKRTKRLLIPVMAWMIPTYFINGWGIFDYSLYGLIDFIKYIIVYPNNGALWFLWVLYAESFILFIICKLLKKDKAINVAIITEIFVCFVLYFFSFWVREFSVKYIIQYGPAFMLGFVLNRYMGISSLKIDTKSKKTIVYSLLLIIYCVLIAGYHYAGVHDCLKIFEQYTNLTVKLNIILEVLLFPLLGSVVFVFLCNCFEIIFQFANNIMKHVGFITMEIYIIHTRCLGGILNYDGLNEFPIIAVITKFFAILVVCQVVIWIVRKVKILDSVLFGRIYQKN